MKVWYSVHKTLWAGRTYMLNKFDFDEFYSASIPRIPVWHKLETVVSENTHIFLYIQETLFAQFSCQTKMPGPIFTNV